MNSIEHRVRTRRPSLDILPVIEKANDLLRECTPLADVLEQDDTRIALMEHANTLGGEVRQKCGMPMDGKMHCKDCWKHGCPVYRFLNDPLVKEMKDGF